jgi:hypothetical protein
MRMPAKFITVSLGRLDEDDEEEDFGKNESEDNTPRPNYYSIPSPDRPVKDLSPLFVDPECCTENAVIFSPFSG